MLLYRFLTVHFKSKDHIGLNCQILRQVRYSRRRTNKRVRKSQARTTAWLRSGEGIGWLAAGSMPNSLYRVPFVYLFLACVFCYSCSFLFVVFLFLFLFCSHWSFVDVPLQQTSVLDWQPRILLGIHLY